MKIYYGVAYRIDENGKLEHFAIRSCRSKTAIDSAIQYWENLGYTVHLEELDIEKSTS